MFDAVITFVTEDVDENGNAFPITKVFRVEFESEEDFQSALLAFGRRSGHMYERLTAK